MRRSIAKLRCATNCASFSDLYSGAVWQWLMYDIYDQIYEIIRILGHALSSKRKTSLNTLCDNIKRVDSTPKSIVFNF